MSQMSHLDENRRPFRWRRLPSAWKPGTQR